MTEEKSYEERIRDKYGNEPAPDNEIKVDPNAEPSPNIGHPE